MKHRVKFFNEGFSDVDLIRIYYFFFYSLTNFKIQFSLASVIAGKHFNNRRKGSAVRKLAAQVSIMTLKKSDRFYTLERTLRLRAP